MNTPNYSFEPFHPIQRGRKGIVGNMEVGEIKTTNSNQASVRLALRRRMNKHPDEVYSWSPESKPIAIRRDA